MERKTVTGSSQIREIGYNESQQILEIKFRNKSVYQYDNVPTVTYEQLMKAESLGKYFYENIRDVFPYRRVE